MRAAGLAGLLALAGCGRGLYSGVGSVTGSGGGLGEWSGAPIACVRSSAFKDMGERSVATLIWQDPRDYTRGQEINVMYKNDAPLRLDIDQEKGGYVGVLRTVDHQEGRRIDPAACAAFRFETRERPALERKGRPALDGELTMDCAVDGGQLKANVRFTRCEY